jgi:hypothetical protein
VPWPESSDGIRAHWDRWPPTGIILGGMSVAGAYAFTQATERIQRRDDIVEPAYPAPPTSVHVSAGPASAMPFDSLGKEGRRFVLMALSPGCRSPRRSCGLPAPGAGAGGRRLRGR